MELQTPKGTRDFSPEEKIIRDKIVSTLKSIFELYGYMPLETPVLERYDVLASKYAGGAEILKETFKLKDQGDRELGLRYDLTVPLARYIGMNPTIKMPFKRYQIGEVFRDGPVASARYRQFTQCDVDVVGTPSLAVEAEIISLIYEAFRQLNLECIVRFNSRKLLNEILDYSGIEKQRQDSVILSIDKLEKIGLNGVKSELREQKVSDDKISKIINFIGIRGSNEEKISQLKNMIKNSAGVREIEDLLEYVKNIDVEADFDVSLARGLSYYTGTVIEAFLKTSSVKSAVCAGGRYDRMISSFLGKSGYEAIGVSFGLDRIYDALLEKSEKNRKTTTQIYVIPIKAINEGMTICQQFRNSGINTDMDSLGRGPSRNLEYANSLGIPYVVFIGKKELEEGKLKLRDMNSGNEEMLTAEEIIQKLK